MLLNMHDDVEMAGRPPAAPSFTLSLEPQLLSRRDSCRNLDRNLSLPTDATDPAAGVAGLRHDSAVPTALRTCSSNGEESLLVAHLPLAVTLRAHCWT